MKEGETLDIPEFDDIYASDVCNINRFVLKNNQGVKKVIVLQWIHFGLD